MASVDPSTLDLTQTSSGDFAVTGPALQEEVQRRLCLHRGSCFWDAEFGSRLHELVVKGRTASTARLAEAYATQALAPMVQRGALTALKVVCSFNEVGQLELRGRALDGAQHPMTFTMFVEMR